MKCIELNRKGDYDCWSGTDLAELHRLQTCEDFYEYSLYRGKDVKMGLIILEPYERTPFRMLKNNFKLVALSGGEAVTRFSNGGISLMLFERGECVSLCVYGRTMINDLQNIGVDVLVMALIEYKDSFSSDGGSPLSFQLETPVFNVH